MKYEITDVWKRKWETETEIPVVTVVVKYVTETGYKGKIEIPASVATKKWIKEAIRKDILNAKKICAETSKTLVIYSSNRKKKEKV